MTKTIASINFEPLSADRAIYQGRFRVPAVKRGDKPFILTVKDHIQIETMPWFKGTFNGKQIQEKRTITGEEIANDLINDWTRTHPDMNPQCCAGVWLVRESVALLDEKGEPQLDADGRQAMRPATAEEKQAMFAEDEAAAKQGMAALGQKWIQKGDIMAEDIKQIPLIPNCSKTAARYYGRDRKWLHDLTDSDIQKCPFCTKLIPADAAKCFSCNEVVNRKRYDELKKQAA